jgi:hypothetical protein
VSKIRDKKEALKPEEKAKPMTKVEMRQKQKKLKEERRKKRDATGVFELSVQAKKVWEVVRREDCPKDKQVSRSKGLRLLSECQSAQRILN